MASRIARICGAPWIAELRDLWVDNPYCEDPAWRLLVDRLLEWNILGSAAGLVSVTPQWAETLRRRYRKPTACILNGYVEEDFPTAPPGPPPGDIVSILYTGNIYLGYRDPGPLFQAIGRLGAERERVAVHFYGPQRADIEPLASSLGVADRVFMHDAVTYKQSLALQTSADVLLLLQWNNAKDAGNIPAKFYEYLGAEAPDPAARLRSGRPGGDDPRAGGGRGRHRAGGDRTAAQTVDRRAAGRDCADRARRARRPDEGRAVPQVRAIPDRDPADPTMRAGPAPPGQRAISTGRLASMMMCRVAPPKIIWRMRLWV